MAVPLLAAGMPNNEVAARLGVAPPTVSNWWRQEAFCVAVELEHREAVSNIQQQMRSLGSFAVDAVRGVLTDPNSSPRAKLKAAEIVLARLDTFSRIAERLPLPDVAFAIVPEDAPALQLVATQDTPQDSHNCPSTANVPESAIGAPVMPLANPVPPPPECLRMPSVA